MSPSLDQSMATEKGEDQIRNQIIDQERIKVIVKPNAHKTELLGYDAARQAYRIAVHAPAEKGKANYELIKFLNKLTKKKVVLVSGKTAKEKVLKLL